MGSDGRSPSTPDAIRPFYPEPSIVTGTLKGFRTPPAMGSDGRSPSTPDAIRPFYPEPLKGFRTSRDGLRRAKPVYARRDVSCAAYLFGQPTYPGYSYARGWNLS